MPANSTPMAVSCRRFARRLDDQPMARAVADGRDGRPEVERRPQQVRGDDPRERGVQMASPMKAIPRRTTYVPTTAHTTPTIADATSARTKNPSSSGARMRVHQRSPRSWKWTSPGAASSW